MNVPQMMTLTGMTTDQVVSLFKERLEEGAYSEVTHMTYLTEIDPAYLREKLTEAFGIIGYGWWYEYEVGDLDIRETGDKGRFTATMKKFALFFRYVLGDPSNGETDIRVSLPIISAGGSSNAAPGDAVKGAITNSLSKAGAMLLWQLDVYKGKLTHRTAGIKREINSKGKNNGDPTQVKKYQASLLQVRANALTSPEEFGSREYWKICNSLGVDGVAGTDILNESNGSWAIAAVAVIDNFGGIEIEKENLNDVPF